MESGPLAGVLRQMDGGARALSGTVQGSLRGMSRALSETARGSVSGMSRVMVRTQTRVCRAGDGL